MSIYFKHIIKTETLFYPFGRETAQQFSVTAAQTTVRSINTIILVLSQLKIRHFVKITNAAANYRCLSSSWNLKQKVWF